MQNLIAAVQDFHTEWMERPPLFTMLIAKTSPADDDQLAQVIEADARHLIDRGIAPRLSRYHQYLYDYPPNQKSRAEAIHAHASGLVEFGGMSTAASEKAAIDELHRLDRDGLARFARIAAEKATAKKEGTQVETDGQLHFTGIIHGPGGSKKSLASLRAADVARVWIRLSMLVVLIVGFLLGLLSAYLSQEKTNEAKKIVTDSIDSGLMFHSTLDGEQFPDRPWANWSWDRRVEWEWRTHRKLFNCEHTLEDFKNRNSDHGGDMDTLRGSTGVEGVDLPTVRENQP